MNFNLKFLLFILLSAFCFLLSVHSVSAANFYIEPSKSECGPGSQIAVDVRINTKNEEINAVSVAIELTGDSVQPEDFSVGGSVINFWIRQPAFKNNQIVFEGLTPGGFNGSNLFLLKVFLSCGKEGETKLSFLNDTQALLNDGKGTKAVLDLLKDNVVKIFVLKTAPVITDAKTDFYAEDKELPEDFEPQIVATPSLFDGRTALVFFTEDKQTGVDYYEVAEKQGPVVEDLSVLSWQKAESPYVLQDQGLKSYIYIKAVDKAGNSRVAVVSPQNALKWYDNYFLWVIIIIGIGVSIFLVKFIKFKFKKEKSADSDF